MACHQCVAVPLQHGDDIEAMEATMIVKDIPHAWMTNAFNANLSHVECCALHESF
jgi:hypothetical protein